MPKRFWSSQAAVNQVICSCLFQLLEFIVADSKCAASMEIDTFDKLRLIERTIRETIRQYNLEDVLTGLRGTADVIPEFIIGGTALFAIRYCKPGPIGPDYRPLKSSVTAHLTDLVAQYQIADPLGFDPSIQDRYHRSNPVFTLLRIFGNQAPYSIAFFGQHARPLILFEEIPRQLVGSKGMPDFDLEGSFHKISGASLSDFVNVGYVSFVASYSHAGFTRGYFEKARSCGFNLPRGNLILPALNKLAAEPSKLRQLYLKYRGADRRFGMYDFNPLFLHPIVRPWKHKNQLFMDADRLVAPLPNLILYRISQGVFYDLFNHYGTTFSNYFGYVFESYVGLILSHSLGSSRLLSENDIRKTYSPAKGKVPDWIIVNGRTAILVECKATRFSRAALTVGDEGAINDSLKQVAKGLLQLANFRDACLARAPGLDMLHDCRDFKPLLVTMEPLYLINSTLFRGYLDNQLAAEGIADLPWRILAVGQIEALQPHLDAGVQMSRVLDDLGAKQFDSILQQIQAKTGLTFKDSYLYSVSKRLDERLGIPDL
jgi:hypothetical protein